MSVKAAVRQTCFLHHGVNARSSIPVLPEHPTGCRHDAFARLVFVIISVAHAAIV
jgi:hypothetical protein